MSPEPSLVFFGTGPVSLATLEGIIDSFEIEAIVTRPDRQLRGQIIIHPVKQFALKHGIAVIEADTKAELTTKIAAQQFKSQLGLVVDFGIIIAPETIARFPKGILNSHFSLLPQWRGPDPITPAIITGATETGVTVMLVEAGLDTGPILAQEKLAVAADVNIFQLTDQLVALSNQMLIKTIPDYLAGKIQPQPQTGPPSQTHKLTKAEGQIDWSKPAAQLEREIRGYLRWPGSYTRIAGSDVIITQAQVLDSSGQPGQPFVTADKHLGVYCGQDALVINKLIPVGKREMTGQEFLAGRKL